jgi:hypothetical protein
MRAYLLLKKELAPWNGFEDYRCIIILNCGVNDCRCRIPECDVDEAIYEPEWLRDAVPYADGKPNSCERYLSRNTSSPAGGSPTNNETVCLPDIFVNTTTVKCRDWVFDTEEWTIANEVSLLLQNAPQNLLLVLGLK